MLHEHQQLDSFGRYLGAPADALLGLGLLSAPLWGQTRAPTTAAYMAGGTFMLTAAVGTWAISDAYEAQRWNARWASLGFVGLGAGLLFACADSGPPCDGRPVSRHLTLAAGVANTGLFLSFFVLSLAAPMPSPRALQLSVRGLPPEQRYERVREFLRERERVRRIGAYVSVPWLLGLGVATLGIAHEVATNGGRAAFYVAGSAVAALSVGLFVYELLYTPDSQRLAAGRLPDD